MKRWFIVICLMVTLLGCTQRKVETQYDRTTAIEEIDYTQLKEKLSSQTDFLLYIGRPDCGDCQVFYPYLEEYVNETGQGIYYLNVKNFRDNAKKEGASQEEIDFYDNLQKNLDFDWTPTLQHYQNNKIIDRYTFLDLDYYGISDETKRQNKFNEFVEEFKEWMEENYEQE
ncbi:MAG: thioredoxin [Beduini sp.]|uniref:thioredoxin n=1 Tax=Beduini sp. TaxID=1922300 RepID=UPI00399F0258